MAHNPDSLQYPLYLPKLSRVPDVRGPYFDIVGNGTQLSDQQVASTPTSILTVPALAPHAPKQDILFMVPNDPETKLLWETLLENDAAAQAYFKLFCSRLLAAPDDAIGGINFGPATAEGSGSTQFQSQKALQSVYFPHASVSSGTPTERSYLSVSDTRPEAQMALMKASNAGGEIMQIRLEKLLGELRRQTGLYRAALTPEIFRRNILFTTATPRNLPTTLISIARGLLDMHHHAQEIWLENTANLTDDLRLVWRNIFLKPTREIVETVSTIMEGKTSPKQFEFVGSNVAIILIRGLYLIYVTPFSAGIGPVESVRGYTLDRNMYWKMVKPS